jgi:8-oxo-dGTP pyrophosphatase MutT (NUDIX family)
VESEPVLVTTTSQGTARVAWTSEHTIEEVHGTVVMALESHHRVEAWIPAGDPDRHRSALWSGMRREGVLRGVSLDGAVQDAVVYARLAGDIPAHEPEGFRSLLNSFLPRKRAISQMLIRDTAGRVLLCQLTYKQDWDLPGGVVEVGESPQLAVSREVEEELGLTIPAGGLLLTDWLPPWSGWDDALCLVFDGGEHPADIVEVIVRQTREIKDAAFCTLEQAGALCADITTRRIASALANLDGGAPAYVEGGA